MFARLRSTYLKLVQVTKQRFINFQIWSDETKRTRQVYLDNPTVANKHTYEHAKRMRAIRLRTFRKSRVARQTARAEYLAAKRAQNLPLRARALAQARSLRGIVEKGGNNTGPEVSRIILANGGTVGEAWCGDFVAYCYRKAGSKAVTRAWAAAWGGYWGWFTGVRRIKPENILPGDLVEYNWQHTGVADERPDAYGNFGADEGNTGLEGKTSDTTRDGAHLRQRNIKDVKAAYRVLR